MLEHLTMSDDRREAGMEVRRAVLGDAHVDRATAGRDGLHARVPGPDHALRVGRDLDAPGPGPAHPLLHHAHRARGERAARGAGHARARGAAQRAVTEDEIKEVLLQCAIYCGVPAANAAFAVARRALEEAGPEEAT